MKTENNKNKISIKELETRLYERNRYIKLKLPKRKYIDMYCMYIKLTIQYFDEKLGLKLAEERIRNWCEDKVWTVPKDEMDIYQYLCSDYLSFFYIRNNAYIERLSPSQLDDLYKRTEKKDFTLRDEDRVFIERTYYSVLTEDLCNGSHSRLASFGPEENGDFWVPASDVVIGYRFGSLPDKQSETSREWGKRYLAYEEKIRELELCNFGIKRYPNHTFIRYDYYSINPGFSK